VAIHQAPTRGDRMGGRRAAQLQIQDVRGPRNRHLGRSRERSRRSARPCRLSSSGRAELAHGTRCAVAHHGTTRVVFSGHPWLTQGLASHPRLAPPRCAVAPSPLSSAASIPEHAPYGGAIACRPAQGSPWFARVRVRFVSHQVPQTGPTHIQPSRGIAQAVGAESPLAVLSDSGRRPCRCPTSEHPPGQGQAIASSASSLKGQRRAAGQPRV